MIMKAAILNNKNTPLEVTEIPIPEISDDEVLVKVEYAGVNPLDNMIVRIRSSVLWGVCITLVSVFVADLIYSHFVPNTGKGITSEVQTTDDADLQIETEQD